MNDSERKTWELMLGIAKRNLSMPITDPDFRMAQEVFLTADAVIQRAGDVGTITSIIAQNKKCGETATAVSAWLLKGG